MSTLLPIASSFVAGVVFAWCVLVHHLCDAMAPHLERALDERAYDTQMVDLAEDVFSAMCPGPIGRFIEDRARKGS